MKAAVLIGSLISAVAAGILLKLRNNKYKRLYYEENLDEDESGIPDIYERHDPAYHLRMAAIHEKSRRASEAGGTRRRGTRGRR